MKIVLAGATGLIGQALVKRLIGKHELVIITRNVPAANQLFYGAGIHFADWHQPPSHLAAMIQGSDALINLAGLGIGDERWTTDRKKAIIGSRIQTIEALAKLFSAAEIKPKVVIQASAVGYYGLDNEKTFTESDTSGLGFLAEVTQKWEQAAGAYHAISERVVILRSGVVLSENGGALPKMIQPFKYFVGGKIGSGKQWVSWVDLEDEINAILFLLENPKCVGPYNLVAPNPIQQKHMAQAIGHAMKRPNWIPAPAFVLKMMLGEMANELLLNGTKAVPQKLMDQGFEFSFETVEASLNEKYKR